MKENAYSYDNTSEELGDGIINVRMENEDGQLIDFAADLDLEFDSPAEVSYGNRIVNTFFIAMS